MKWSVACTRYFVGIGAPAKWYWVSNKWKLAKEMWVRESMFLLNCEQIINDGEKLINNNAKGKIY